MWAGSLLLRIGERRDLLVSIRADTELSLERLSVLFNPWLARASDRPTDNGPSFGVRLAPVGGREVRPPGIRPVPQLRFGSSVMARSRNPDDILRALTMVLGGAHLYRRDDGRVWTGMRPFVAGRSMVLVDADRPTMVNDRQLATVGIEELAVWSTVIEPDGTASVPPALPGLDWGQCGLEPSPGDWGRYQLRGIVALHRHEYSRGELVAELAGRSVSARWFELVATMAETGRLTGAGDRSTLRDRVKILVESPATDDR